MKVHFDRKVLLGFFLALSILTGSVSQHGSKIWAEAGVNIGASFFFFIPTQNLN